MYIQIYIIEIKSFPLVFAGTQYFRFTVQLSIFIALRGGNDITVVADVAFYLGVHKSDFKGHPIRDDEVDNAANAMVTATSLSPWQPLTATRESSSATALPLKRQGVSSPGMLLAGASSTSLHPELSSP